MKIVMSLFMLIPFLLRSQELSKSNLTTETSNNNSQILWIEDLTWEQIIIKASKENKFIFIDAYATWCIPCKEMDKKVFIDKSVSEVINKHFVPVKIQMNETDKDSDKIRARYKDAQYISAHFKPDGYPCFLFFSPNGSLVYKSIGFQGTEMFIATAMEALSNPSQKYEISIQKFKNNQIDIKDLPALARLAAKNNDYKMADRIANKYKAEFLDKLDEKDAYSSENLKFVADFSKYILNSEDKYFLYFFKNSKQADSIINFPSQGAVDRIHVAIDIVESIIRNEEITDKIFSNKNSISHQKPEWDKIKNVIKSKYGSAFVNKFFPDEQIKFYRSIGDSKKYVKYVNRKIKTIAPKSGGRKFYLQFGDSWGLNVYAWELFNFCDKKKLLKHGLRWSTLSISLSVQERKDSSGAIQYLDTKANLLYRLGRKLEAIELEQKAISLIKPGHLMRKEYELVLYKMINGQPTWPQ